MAKVIVEGKIARTFYGGRGAELVEEFTVKGEPRSKRWACWFEEPHGLSEGQQVTISGLHGDEVDSWEKDGQSRHSVKRSINRARANATQDSQEPRSGTNVAPGDSYTPTGDAGAQSGDSWNVPSTGGEYDATPF